MTKPLGNAELRTIIECLRATADDYQCRRTDWDRGYGTGQRHAADALADVLVAQEAREAESPAAEEALRTVARRIVRGDHCDHYSACDCFEQVIYEALLAAAQLVTSDPPVRAAGAQE